MFKYKYKCKKLEICCSFMALFNDANRIIDRDIFIILEIYKQRYKEINVFSWMSQSCKENGWEIVISDGSVVSFQKTAVAVLASVVVFFKTAVAVLMRLC